MTEGKTTAFPSAYPGVCGVGLGWLYIAQFAKRSQRQLCCLLIPGTQRSHSPPSICKDADEHQLGTTCKLLLGLSLGSQRSQVLLRQRPGGRWRMGCTTVLNVTADGHKDHQACSLLRPQET